MRTVKQVAELTGVSVRTLQYYDEINLFKPTAVTDAGYRLYNDDALEVLQQILFFRELDFPLKDIKEIMENPNFEKKTAYKKQKELIKLKRDRLNELLSLLDKLEKGESCMSFKEFGLSDYFIELECFRGEHSEDILKYWGSLEAFDEMVEEFKEKESEIAKTAIQVYGSVEKYTEAMKAKLSDFTESMNQIQVPKSVADNWLVRNKEIHVELSMNLTRDVETEEVQSLVRELILLNNEITKGMDLGDNYWDFIADRYLIHQESIDVNDKIYGEGSSVFIGKALKAFLRGEA